MRLGFVGAGRMGRPMVRRLHAAGHQVRVLARSEQARAGLLAEGVAVASSLDLVATGAEAVLVCVHTDEQVREVCLEGGMLDAMAPGALLILHTTGSPATADALAERGATVLDAPVSGGPHDIAAGRITLFVGGDTEAVARAKPIFDTYSDKILHVGPGGHGQRVKLLNNALFAANIGLVAAVVDLAAQLGVEEHVLLEALPNGSSASRALQGVSARGSVAGFAEATGEFLGKDVAVARQVVDELGADLGLLGAAHRVLAGLVAAPEQARALAP
jgi:3-hydroxyisobutyrate dehydrogenase-like beta-hydroxyacid dehydrogenase